MLKSNSPSFDKPKALIQMTNIKYIDRNWLNVQLQLLVILYSSQERCVLQ